MASTDADPGCGSTGPRIVRWRYRGTAFLPLLAGMLAVATAGAATARLNVEQIVARHVAARGGAAAWHAVHTLSMNGTLEAGSGDSLARSRRTTAGRHPPARGAVTTPAAAPAAEADRQVKLHFTLALARPGKSRLEVEFEHAHAVQVYDGTAGWKLRPYLHRDVVEPFSADEARAAAEQADVEDPLIDYAAKGSRVALIGVEPVEGRDAFHLRVTPRSGRERNIWIDAVTFLDVRVDAPPRRLDDALHNVWVTQRDFRTIGGLTMPYVLDTAVDGSAQTHKVVLDSVKVNPALDAATFSKPTA